MTIYHPKTALEAVLLRKENADTSVYLAGGTDDLRLGGSGEGKDLIDINGLDECFDTITLRDGKVWIGARCTLQQVAESELVPDFIRQSTMFCASFARRNSATIGGNVALRRSDSYMAAALTAAEALLDSITPYGEEKKAIGEYLKSDCKRFIRYIVVEQNRSGWVRRFGNTSAGHATLIAAHSEGVYALSVSGSDFTYGNTADLAKDMTFADDITGSAAYKKYLAETVFTLGR